LPDIFDEVEEDLRAERARSFGRRFAGLFAAALVLVLVGTGAYVWWSQKTQIRAEAVAQTFLDASKQADKAALPLGGLDKSLADQAAASFQSIATKAPPGYAVLARLRLAALQWQLGREPAAIATWQSVANDTGAPKLLRDLATLVSAQHQVDSANPVILKQTVEALTAQDNPWRPMAEQVIALIDLRMGKTHDAEMLMTRLTTDPMAPEGIRQMVADLLSALPPAPAPDTAPAAAKPPAPPTPASAKPASHG